MRANFFALIVAIVAVLSLHADEKTLFDAFVQAEIEKIKAMPEEQQWTYFRTSTTANRMAVLALAIKAYKLQHARYPLAKSARELEPMLHPDIMAKVSTTDAWGTEFRYVALNDGQSYRLVSAGSDGHFHEASWTKRGRLAKADEDAVTENGEAVRHWDDDTKPGATAADRARAALEPRARTRLERADALVKANDHAGALQAYVEAVKLDRRAASLDAIASYKASSFVVDATPASTEAARAALAAALRQYLELHPGHMEATREFVTVSTPAEAEALLAPMLRATPNDAELYALRGRVRAQTERHDDALADFTRSAELDASNPERHYILGVVLYELATKGENVTAERTKELIRRGLASLERAEALREGYFESMVYRSLLLRASASLETDAARQTALTQQADALREQARATMTARRTAASAAIAAAAPPPPPAPQPLRVGGDVKAPRVVTRVATRYDGTAKGLVIIEAVIDSNGRVRDAKLVRTLPDGAGDAALEAVRQWTFEPGTHNGKAVDVIYMLSVEIPAKTE